jgi:hypothetical protein
MSNYTKFRGRCKELSDKACVEDPTLKLIRGHYYCPIWNTEEPHWWCEREDGTIHDPSSQQFPSNGNGTYIPFDGTVACAECGRKMQEEDASFEGNYAFCSTLCKMRFVGLTPRDNTLGDL